MTNSKPHNAAFLLPSTHITVTKTATGLRRMVIVASNAYIDREDEIVKESALRDYVDKSWSGDEFKGDNVLLWWHGGDKIGDIVFADMMGPFLVEVANEIPDKVINLAGKGEDPFYTRIKTVWDSIEKNAIEWGASIGFAYDTRTKDGNTYTHLAKLETSVLPRAFAANSFTLSKITR